MNFGAISKYERNQPCPTKRAAYTVGDTLDVRPYFCRNMRWAGWRTFQSAINCLVSRALLAILEAIFSNCKNCIAIKFLVKETLFLMRLSLSTTSFQFWGREFRELEKQKVGALQFSPAGFAFWDTHRCNFPLRIARNST